MAQPRPIEPSKTYLVTRNCSQRQFLLRPSEVVNCILLYCLAMAALLTGVKVHAVCVMSNHFHVVITDEKGRLPAFMHWLCLFTAKCLNVHYGRSEAVWAPAPYNAVELASADDILRYTVYTLTNPARAGLVEDSSTWPGLWLAPQPTPSTIMATRPTLFFRPNGKTPEQVGLRLERPDAFAHLTDEEWAHLVAEGVRERDEALRRAAAAEGRTFRGREAVLADSPFATPTTPAPRGRLHPLFAGPQSIIQQGLRRLREFRSDYRAAWLRFRAGDRDAPFPAGTYALRVYYGVNCAPAAPARLLDGAVGPAGPPGHCPV